MKTAIPTILIGLACVLPARAEPGENRYIERLEPFIQKTMQEAKVPGLAVGIVEAGRPVYVRGFGVMDARDPARPVTAETLFHMASVTKPFVATSVMQLAEQGRVELDAPMTRYLPYFQLKDSRYRAITVRLMLTHTSGMPDVEDYLWDKPEFDDGALERYVRSLQDKSLRWEPGRKFAYSNMAYEVLGDLVAKVSGMSFEDYVTKNILKPADDGFLTAAVMLPARKTGVVVLINSDRAPLHAIERKALLVALDEDQRG